MLETISPLILSALTGYPVVSSLHEFVISYHRPASVSTSLTVLQGQDLINPPPQMLMIGPCVSPGVDMETVEPCPPQCIYVCDIPEEQKHKSLCPTGELQVEGSLPLSTDGNSCTSHPSLINGMKKDENPMRYCYRISDELSKEKAKALTMELVQRKQFIEQRSAEPLPKVDLHALDNTIIPKEEWYPIYKPYSARLTDLRSHLHGPQLLPYECMVELIDQNAAPFISPAYTIRHPDQRKALENNINKYLDMDIIEHGPSTWKTALFVVPQKVNQEQKLFNTYHPSQQWRVIQNFIPLNIKVQKAANTLPLVADIFQVAADKSIFSLLDLSKAFFQCTVREVDRIYFGVSHPTKDIHMRCMPMGFINSPAIWQKNMNIAIWHSIQKAFHDQYPSEKDYSHLAIYMDDIFLATKASKQHLLLKTLFEHLVRYSLTLSVGKSFIGKRSAYLLKKIISPCKRYIQPERPHALSLLAPPQTVFQVCFFLGALCYIAEHVPRLNELLHPFDACSGGVPASRAAREYIPWTNHLLSVFDTIKTLLKKPSSLSHFIPSRPLYLATDASNTGYGAFLFQTNHVPLESAQIFPLAFSSQAWKTNSEHAAHSCRKELDALK